VVYGYDTFPSWWCLKWLQNLTKKLNQGLDSNVSENFCITKLFLADTTTTVLSLTEREKRNTPRVCVIVWWSKVPSHFWL
jgi:hypothetical protein